MGLSDLKLFNELVVVMVAAAGALKSAWNGTIEKYVLRRLRLAEQAHTKTVQMEETLARIEANQETQTDAFLTLVEAVEDDDVEFDSEQFREDIGREDPDRYSADD